MAVAAKTARSLCAARPARRVATVRLALILLTLLTLPLALAQTPRRLWEQGEFEAAYTAALRAGQAAEEAAGTAQNAQNQPPSSQASSMYLLASRAAADMVAYEVVAPGTDGVRRWLDLSLAAAERSVALAPEAERDLLSQAVMAKARAKGEVARRSGVLQNLNVAGELKQLFDRALALNPSNPDALVGLGMWHLELVLNNVGWLYGGRRDQVLPLVEAGVAAAPKQVNLRVEYATALQALGEPERAREQLEAALSLPGVNAVDRAEQQRARALLADFADQR